LKWVDRIFLCITKEKEKMAVKIRLKRIGAKKKPAFRIIVADDKSARDGAFIEEIGTYSPTKKKEVINLKKERVKYWLNNGAVASETVKNILKRQNIEENI
jgi:small subunit ribosomal protein S16